MGRDGYLNMKLEFLLKAKPSQAFVFALLQILTGAGFVFSDFPAIDNISFIKYYGWERMWTDDKGGWREEMKTALNFD